MEQPTIQVTQTASQPTTPISTPTLEATGSSWIVTGILIFILILVLYFAYSAFTKNKSSFTSGLEQEKDGTANDFNLEDGINDLNSIQAKIVNKLSNDTGF